MEYNEEVTHSNEEWETPKDSDNSKLLILQTMKDKVADTLNLKKIFKKNEKKTPTEVKIEDMKQEEDLRNEEPECFKDEKSSIHNDASGEMRIDESEKDETMVTSIRETNKYIEESNEERVNDVSFHSFEKKDEEQLHREESRENYLSAKNSDSHFTMNSNESIKDNAMSGNDNFKEVDESSLISIENPNEFEIEHTEEINENKNCENEISSNVQDSAKSFQTQDSSAIQKEKPELLKETMEPLNDEDNDDEAPIISKECTKGIPEVNNILLSEESKVIEEKENETIEINLNAYETLQEMEVDAKVQDDHLNEDSKVSSENIQTDKVSMDRSNLNHSDSEKESWLEDKEIVDEKKGTFEELEKDDVDNDKFDLSFSIRSSISNIVLSQKSSNKIHSPEAIEMHKGVIPPVNLKPITSKKKVERTNSNNSEQKAVSWRAESTSKTVETEKINSNRKIKDSPSIPESSRNKNSSRNMESSSNKNITRNKENYQNKEKMKMKIWKKEPAQPNSNRNHPKDTKKKNNLSEKKNTLQSLENTERSKKNETYFGLFDINKKRVSVFDNFINKDETEKTKEDASKVKKMSKRNNSYSGSNSETEESDEKEESNETEDSNENEDSSETEENSETEDTNENKDDNKSNNYEETSDSSENKCDDKMNSFTECASSNNALSNRVVKIPMQLNKNSLKNVSNFGKVQVNVFKMSSSTSKPHDGSSNRIPKYAAAKIGNRTMVQKKKEPSIPPSLKNTSDIYIEENSSFVYNNPNYGESQYLNNPQMIAKNSCYNNAYLNYNYPGVVPNNDYYYNNKDFSGKPQKKSKKSIGIQTIKKKMKSRGVNTVNFMLTKSKEKEKLPNFIFQPTLKLPNYNFEAIKVQNGTIVSKQMEFNNTAFSDQVYST